MGIWTGTFLLWGNRAIHQLIKYQIDMLGMILNDYESMECSDFLNKPD